MRKFLFVAVLLLLTLTIGYGQTIVSTISGDKFTVLASSSDYISLLGEDVNFSLRGPERDTFIKLLDVSIDLLDGASKLGLTDDTSMPVLYVKFNESVKINTTIRMYKPEPLVTFYIQCQGTYALVDFNKANLQEWRTAFLAAYDLNKKVTASRQSLSELVLSIQGKFASK